MKSYLVDLDVTMSVRVYVEANSIGEANEMALKKIEKEPYHYLRNSAFVDAVVVDNFEEKE